MTSKTPQCHEHEHVTKDGFVVKCYHECRSLFTDWRFILGITISYPFEHFIWEHIWPFMLLTQLLNGH